jgi:uncharacterized protein (UPF0335 family)
MTDTTTINAPGGRLPAGESPGATNNNTNGASAELKRRIDRRVKLLEDAAELAAQLKDYKAEDKDDGFTEAAIADSVRLRRADPEKVLRRLLLEAEFEVYRRAAGLPVSIERAQEIARDAAGSVPEPKKYRQEA